MAQLASELGLAGSQLEEEVVVGKGQVEQVEEEASGECHCTASQE